MGINMKSAWLLCLVVMLSGCGMTPDQAVYDIYGDSGEDDLLNKQLSDLHFKIELLSQQGLCNHDSECNTVGIGTKPCGGNRYYFAYSSSSTNLTQLMSAVREYNVLDNQLDHRIETVDKCILGVDPGSICRLQRCMLNL